MYIVFVCRKCGHQLYVPTDGNLDVRLISGVAVTECPSCGEEGYENWILSRGAAEPPKKRRKG